MNVIYPSLPSNLGIQYDNSNLSPRKYIRKSHTVITAFSFHLCSKYFYSQVQDRTDPTEVDTYCSRLLFFHATSDIVTGRARILY